MELYHIHRINAHGNYEVGQILHPGTAFNSMHESFLNLSSSFPATTKEINGKTINYMTRFDEYLGKVMESDNISPEELKKILLFARSYTLNSSINTREMILEEVRRESYPTLPSRYSCIWLTDDDSFFHWLQELKSGKKYVQLKLMVIYFYLLIHCYQVFLYQTMKCINKHINIGILILNI